MKELCIANIGGRQLFDGDWHSSPPKRIPTPASLTEFLKQVPEFQKALLPRSQSAITRLNRLVRSQAFIKPSATTKERSWYGRVGQAVDRAALYMTGADLLREPQKWLAKQTSAEAKALSQILIIYSPPHIRKNGKLTKDLLGWLWILGSLDPVMRGFLSLAEIDTSDIPHRISKSSARKWLAKSLPGDIAIELQSLINILRIPNPKGKFRPNPIFGAWGVIIGSDGDWIRGSTLVELKCTIKGVHRAHVMQILGYWAIDRLNRLRGRPDFGFTRLALCLPRHSSFVNGTVDEWLAAFGGPQPEVFLEIFARYCVSFPSSFPEKVSKYPPYPWAAQFGLNVGN